MSIQVAPQVNNVVNTDEPIYQDWSPVPGLTVFDVFLSGSAIPLPIVKQIKIKDVIGLQSTTMYSDFRFFAYRNYVGTYPVNQWLNIANDYELGIHVQHAITSNGTVDNITFSVYNYLLQNVGTHEAVLKYVIQGRNSSNEWINLYEYFHTIRLRVFAQNTITFSPGVLNITHYQNTPFFEYQINMSGLNWRLEAPQHYILLSDDSEVTVSTEIINDQTFYKAVGSGQRTVKIKLSSFFNTEDAVGSIYLQTAVRVMTGTSTVIGSVGINVTLLNTNEFDVDPDEIFFTAIKNQVEPTERFIFVHCTEDYTIQASPWLIITPVEPVGELQLNGIMAVPIPTANMDAGIYIGEIVFSATINGVFSQITVIVNYDLQDFVTIPYSPDEFNFTLDKKFINFNTEIAQTYFELILTAVVYDFFTNQEKTVTVPLKIPIFRGSQEFNVGLGIHKLMKRMESLNLISNNQYKLAKVMLEFKEKYLNNDELIREFITSEYLFVAGLQPEQMINNCAILNINDNFSRVTKNGFQYLNLLGPIGTRQITIKKNDVIINDYFIYAEENIYTDRIEFENLNVVPGDIIDFIYHVGADQTIKKTFIVFPEGLESTFIIWENEYYLKSILELTGKYSIKSDIESKTETLYQKITEIFKSIDNIKVSKLTINTGFVLKSDTASVESLSRSKRAWLFDSESNIIELVPITKSLTTTDSDQELISYDLEFQINRNYNEEICSF